ncbi:class I SAM-dependent methyltransferase [Chitinilyticum litopenaei]|uniref:class I SAM-dependent methyltransferase n=1 Tax=Chitinilyticum litopenaei TaxID=1121276 RepID=UPI001B7FADA6|nr:class I SAM-dependent methyltransferase [Chitinilyticum litopenaei]
MPADFHAIFNQVGARYSLDDFETLNLGQHFCPSCRSSDRDRLYALFIWRHLAQYTPPPLRILDIAPAPALGKMLRNLPGVLYRSADLSSPLADERVDICDMRTYRDNSFNFIVCSHVLEHVEDDSSAIRELYRVLEPGGVAILMVPILLSATSTDEDPHETRIEERWRRFGQNDHLRMYCKHDFVARLQQGGFTVQALSESHFGSGQFPRHGITPQSVLYIGRKN